MRNQAEIWKQQKYNNSCAWDCFAMLLSTQGVETSSLELVGSSHVPYQIRLHPDENRLSAGMLVQKDANVNAVLGKYGFQLHSRRAATISSFIALAGETLLKGEAFVTSIKRSNNLPGRHAVVFTDICESCFLGLDPDCLLDRSKNYSFSDVREAVALEFTEEEFCIAVTGNEGFVPLLGTLSPCVPHEPESTLLQDFFKNSETALEFYGSATEHLDFATRESLPIVYSVLKPIVSDLRTAIEMRDECLNQISETALFLKAFENEILNFRRLVKSNEAISREIENSLHDSLVRSYSILKDHLSLRHMKQ